MFSNVVPCDKFKHKCILLFHNNRERVGRCTIKKSWYFPSSFYSRLCYRCNWRSHKHTVANSHTYTKSFRVAARPIPSIGASGKQAATPQVPIGAVTVVSARSGGIITIVCTVYPRSAFARTQGTRPMNRIALAGSLLICILL